MKVQNNQPSFGMALKINKNVYEMLEQSGDLREFKKAIPRLEKAAATVDINMDALVGADGIKYTVTPLNRLGLNNYYTRSVYEARKLLKTGSWLQPGTGKPASSFVSVAEVAKKDLDESMDIFLK